MSYVCTQEFKWCREGCEDLQDDPRGEEPSSAHNSETVAEGNVLVARDHQMTYSWWRIILSIHGIWVVSSLWRRKKKLCTKFVPHSPMDEQKDQRVTTCKEFIWTCQISACFLSYIINGDESWKIEKDVKSVLQSRDIMWKKIKQCSSIFHVYQFL